MRSVLIQMCEKYRKLVNEVQYIHRLVAFDGHHGLDHDLMVAQYGYLIAGDARTSELAWVAGLMHSIDRLISLISKQDVQTFLDGFINCLPDSISSEEIELIVEALGEHSKLNDPDDNPVTVALKDADRLANLGFLNLIRGGQQRPNLHPLLWVFMTDCTQSQLLKILSHA